MDKDSKRDKQMKKRDTIKEEGLNNILSKLNSGVCILRVNSYLISQIVIAFE